MNAVNAGRHAIPVETQWELDEFAPAQRPYHGRHRAEDRLPAQCYECETTGQNCRAHRAEAAAARRAERPPSPTYSFTLVEQPGGAS